MYLRTNILYVMYHTGDTWTTVSGERTPATCDEWDHYDEPRSMYHTGGLGAAAPAMATLSAAASADARPSPARASDRRRDGRAHPPTLHR